MQGLRLVRIVSPFQGFQYAGTQLGAHCFSISGLPVCRDSGWCTLFLHFRASTKQGLRLVHVVSPFQGFQYAGTQLGAHCLHFRASTKQGLRLVHVVSPFRGFQYAGAQAGAHCFSISGLPLSRGSGWCTLFLHFRASNMQGLSLVLIVSPFQGFQYAGTQLGAHCFCGDEYKKYGEVKQCTSACSGNNKHVCGGRSANLVFKTGRYMYTYL